MTVRYASLFVVLAACAPTQETRPHTATTTATPSPPFAAQSAVDRWVASLRAESAECTITVTNTTADQAMVTLEAAHPPPGAANAPPTQIPIVHVVFVHPFMPEADVGAKRAAMKQRVDACIADAGPGHRSKGRDMNVETCAITEGERLPTHHVDTDFSVDVPSYFMPPNGCEKAAAALRARLTPYP